MTKRILALTLCLAMLCMPLLGCSKKTNDDPGAYITMYLTDEIYDFDPASAYYNTDAVNVLSLMYDTLFKLDENGKVKKSLVESYRIVEKPETDEYYIEFTLKEAYWSTREQITADHVVFAWKRLVDFRNDFDAASLLYDIKNARAIKEGDVTVDDLGVEAVESRVVKVTFEKQIDYDRFLLNLTSVATAPLLERFVTTNDDWAKKSSTMAVSGPFRLGKFIFEEEKYFDEEDNEEKKLTVSDDNALIKEEDEPAKIGVKDDCVAKRISSFYLERNQCYYRDFERDKLTKSVKPYRLLVDCTMTDEEILESYKNGRLFYVGNIPLSIRTGDNAEFIEKKAEVSNALSTFAIQLNQDALVSDGGEGTYLFANSTVRKALSMAIDRNAIAEAVVFAEAANAFVPNGVFDANRKDEFRTSKQATALIETSANIQAAKDLLADAEITPDQYSFTIKVAAHDEVHVAMTEMVCASWAELGFNVEVEKVYPIENNDYTAQYDDTPKDVCDDLFVEAVQFGKFEAIALDVNAFTADAYSMLSNYAYAFSGKIYADADNDIYEYNTHITGYNSVKYNVLMEAIYYIPYFASIDTLDSTYLVSHLETKPYELSAKASTVKFNVPVSALKAQKELLTTDAFTNGKFDERRPVVVEATQNIRAQLEALLLVCNQTSRDIVAAEASADLTKAAQDSCAEVAALVSELLAKEVKDLDRAVKAIPETNNKNNREKLEQAVTSAIEIIDSIIDGTALKSANNAFEAVKGGTNQKTLKELIQEIYDANGIVPSAKKSDWTKQKSVLLHKAEELLMEDLPVIPVVYNQHAVLIHKDLSKVKATYYAPATFQKTKLRKYKKYVYYNEAIEKTESIFKSFPEIKWDEMDD